MSLDVTTFFAPRLLEPPSQIYLDEFGFAFISRSVIVQNICCFTSVVPSGFVTAPVELFTKGVGSLARPSVIQFEPSSASFGMLKRFELVLGVDKSMEETGLITCGGTIHAGGFTTR